MTDLREQIALKPCPWCSGPAFVIEDRGDGGAYPLLFRPQCMVCGGGLGGYDKRADAIADWNRRALIQPPEGYVPAPEWRDISTAPRDGTRVFLFIPGFRGDKTWTGLWAGEHGVIDGGPKGAWFYSNGRLAADEQPTHWMPLPPEPATPEKS